LQNIDCKFRIIKKIPINTSEKIEFCGNLENLDEVIKYSDVLINALPLSNETKGRLMQKTYDLKKNSVIVNVSRAGILNEKEILQRIINKDLLGAIFDVYPKDINCSKYLENKNIILTPHIAAIYGNNLERLALSIKKQIELCT
jgi:phosphoglycerate dehydrogenase-like enzyme